MSYQLTEQSFLKDVADCQMHILMDNGLYRHIRFKRPDTGCYHFDIVTYPSYLVYSGDMGCFVFSRLPDMFQFFRVDGEHLRDGQTLGINPDYWSEKLQAVDKGDGYKEYSQEKFEQIVNEYVDEYIEDAELRDSQIAVGLREAVGDEVINCGESQQDAYDAASNFSHGDFEFRDFWERDLTEYTHRFIWCCYALAWGIKQYDATKTR